MPKKRNGKKLSSGFIAAIIALIIILAVGIPFIFEYKKANEKSLQKYYGDWLPDNCNCLERGRIVCANQTFVVQDNFCINKDLKQITNVVKSCSRYNCSNQLYEFNLETQKWDAPENG